MKELISFIHAKTHVALFASVSAVPISVLIAKLSPILAFGTLVFAFITGGGVCAINVYHWCKSAYFKIKAWIAKRKAT